MTTRLFGERVPRTEDARLVTGRGRFVADFEPHAAHAAFVRSDHAHARILGIDVSEAAAMPGVLGVFVHADLDGGFADRLPLLVPSDKLIAPHTQFALARDEVCYMGEVVAMVVRPGPVPGRGRRRTGRRRLRAAPRRGRPGRRRGRGPVAHLDMTDNVAGVVAEETGDVDAAMASADHVFEWSFAMERSASMPLETRGVVARYDAAESRLLVHDATPGADRGPVRPLHAVRPVARQRPRRGAGRGRRVRGEGHPVLP